MAKKFGGFTEQQKEVLARKMGFNGPMDKFGEFLNSSPSHAQKFVSYENKAKAMVEGVPSAKPQAAFADGGTVTDPLKITSTSTTTTKNSKKTPEDPFKDVNAISSSISNSEGANLTDQYVTNPETGITQVQTANIPINSDQFISSTSGQVQANPDVQGAGPAQTAQAEEPTATAAPQVTTATVTPQVEAATQDMQAAKGTVSQQAQVEAATALPSADATVQGQLTKLMTQFEGSEPPPWAAGAIRNANAIMAQRGLGASSMAGMAVTQAAMESAIQVAAQDAATFSNFEMQNLNNRQQARLVNAQSFLQMDLANLNNEQQMTMFKSQSIIQGLFTDQAAENASRQFNATSQSQTDQFFANLKTQVSTFNTAQKNAMSQFNTEQQNSIEMFNRQMADARDQFNAQNRLIIDQSNAEWRRAVSTADTAAINEANRIDAQNATALTTAAYNNLMQRERDLYSFAFAASESSKQRATDITLAKMQASSASKSATGEVVGSLVGSVVDGIFSKW